VPGACPYLDRVRPVEFDVGRWAIGPGKLDFRQADLLSSDVGMQVKVSFRATERAADLIFDAQ